MENSQKSGVVGSVDLQSLETMKAKYEEEIEKSRQRGQEFCKHRAEYKSLMNKLETITDKTTHEVMVPFTKKAFMPGRLVHTNEILVLLGDNWFVERSAKQAREICNRRLLKCDETLRGIDQEIGLYENWLKEATQIAGDAEHGEGNIEIREEVDVEELERWKQERREKVREAKLKENQSMKEGLVDDEAYWKRLEELEMKEELDEYLERQDGAENEEEDEETEDESESDWGSEDDDENEKSPTMVRGESFEDKPESLGDSGKSMWQQMEEIALEKELDHHFQLKKDRESSKAPTDRKVSFGENTEHVIAGRHQLEPEPEPKNVIKFDHSTTVSKFNEASSNISNSSTPETPGDLYTMFGPTRARSPTKSILKQTSYPESQVLSEDENDEDISFQPKKAVYAEPAVADLVQEREVVYTPPEPPQVQAPTAKKQSLFKQNRRK